MARRKIYENLVRENISLPEETHKIANERRGQIPMARFLGMLVCNALGTKGINDA